MKNTSGYICQLCGFSSFNWFGKCPQCQEWGTLAEEEISVLETKQGKVRDIVPQCLKTDETGRYKRIATGIRELDRTLGGGAVKGSVILLGGDPGIGKSTLLLQAAGAAREDVKCLYICGEESVEQTRLRAERINALSEHVQLISETALEPIIKCITKYKPQLVIADSIQVLYSDVLGSAPGTVGQVRYCSGQLVRLAKSNNIVFFIVGHITKSGMIAGPKVVEHLVDTVLYFEGGKQHAYRIVRAVKNRFGSTDEIAIFNMTEKGLIEVENPSELFISERKSDISGSVVVSCMEGSRPILIEIQALVTASYGVPKRRATGFDVNRLMLLIAVLEKRCGLLFNSQDVFINIAGGVKINETAADLAVCLALTSALKDIPVKQDNIFIGEVGLGGEVRSVVNLKRRINESVRLGFTSAFVPEGNSDD
ncbi:MAG: DNA repair protein RadA, partial [bacterium]|nr:DNA repair protein RadA [bacterium]